MPDVRGLSIGPIEAVVGQLSLGFGSIAWVLSGLEGFAGVDAVAVAPLLGLAWVAARIRERRKADVVDGVEDSVDPIEEGST